ncbi:MAG: ABC transporter ATP-binding protein [Desulfofustis sp.]
MKKSRATRMSLNIENATVIYPAVEGRPPTEALQQINLTMDVGDFVVAIGASGCGKSTLLNLIAGFLAPTEGRIILDGASVEGPGADRSVVFQKHALLPWLNVRDNIEFGLMLQGNAKQDRHHVADRFIQLLGLSGFEDSPVYALSGGMQQRVGIARALTCDPKLLLMDEPLGALDALTREKAQELILQLWHDTGKSVFFITHSVEEALFMGTRLVVMSPRPGRITHEFDLPFSKKFLDGTSARTVSLSKSARKCWLLFLQMRRRHEWSRKRAREQSPVIPTWSVRQAGAGAAHPARRDVWGSRFRRHGHAQHGHDCHSAFRVVADHHAGVGKTTFCSVAPEYRY